MPRLNFREPLKIPHHRKMLRQTRFFSRSSFVMRSRRLLLRTACIFSHAEACEPIPYNKVWLGFRSSLPQKRKVGPGSARPSPGSPMLRQLASEPSSGIKTRYNRCGEAERLYNSREAIPFLEVPFRAFDENSPLASFEFSAPEFESSLAVNGQDCLLYSKAHFTFPPTAPRPWRARSLGEG